MVASVCINSVSIHPGPVSVVVSASCDVHPPPPLPDRQVLVVDLEEEAVTESDVLVMATDGLWDVISNQRAAELVDHSLAAFPADDVTKRRYRWACRHADWPGRSFVAKYADWPVWI